MKAWWEPLWYCRACGWWNARYRNRCSHCGTVPVAANGEET